MEPNIGIAKEHRAAAAALLCKILANEVVLTIKTRKAHWNIEGPDFFSKHKFFEEQYHQLDEIVDEVAERVRSLGHYAPGSLKEFLELTELTERSTAKNTGAGYAKELLDDHEAVIINLRKAVESDTKAHDLGGSDFITGLIETHEKIAWMLRSHLA